MHLISMQIKISPFFARNARARKRNHCRQSGMHGALGRHKTPRKKCAKRRKNAALIRLNRTRISIACRMGCTTIERKPYTAYIVAHSLTPQRNFQLEMLDATFRMTNHQIKLCVCACACVRRWPCENLFTSIPFRLHYHIRGFINIK